MTRGCARVVLVAALLGMPTWAQAQTAAGSIAGVVRDTTGAVLPGVTVEATSPALIEKVRTAVTDGEGRYQIAELRPGTYSVTFALEGFNSVRREGIELTTGFTAAINADLQVGSVAETITVSGQSPVVDLQNTKQQVVVTRDVIDSVPTGRSFQNLGDPDSRRDRRPGGRLARQPGRRRQLGPELHDAGHPRRSPDRSAHRPRRHVDLGVDAARFVGDRLHRRQHRGIQHQRRRQLGRHRDRRGAHQPHSTRGRQHVQGQLLRQLGLAHAAGREQQRRPAGARPARRQQARSDVERQPDLRRARSSGTSSGSSPPIPTAAPTRWSATRT